MKALGVFCGSAMGTNPIYAATARELGRTLAQRDISLVYGGGRIGLMGQVATACLAEGGRVIGVIPRLLSQKEIAFKEVTELILSIRCTREKPSWRSVPMPSWRYLAAMARAMNSLKS